MTLFTAIPGPFRPVMKDSAFLHKVIGHSWDQILLFDAGRELVHTTPSMNPGLPAPDTGTGDFLNGLEPEHRSDFLMLLGQAWGSEDVFLLEYLFRKDDRSEVWVKSKFLYYRGETDQDSCVMVLTKEITKYKEQEAHLRSLANMDPLTQLPNRRGLKEHYLKMLAFSKRYGMSFGVLYLDVDDFKGINDRFGHAGGDIYLKHVARVVQHCLRDSDLLARIGGDEFVILLHHVPDSGVLRTVIDRIYSRLASGLELEGEHVDISVSIGASVYPEHGDSLETLLHQADGALYEIKNGGKNGYRLCGSKEAQSRAAAP